MLNRNCRWQQLLREAVKQLLEVESCCSVVEPVDIRCKHSILTALGHSVVVIDQDISSQT